MKAEQARENVADFYNLSEAIELIEKASKQGKTSCMFKGRAIDYYAGLRALGYRVIIHSDLLIEILWK